MSIVQHFIHSISLNYVIVTLCRIRFNFAGDVCRKLPIHQALYMTLIVSVDQGNGSSVIHESETI